MLFDTKSPSDASTFEVAWARAGVVFTAPLKVVTWAVDSVEVESVSVELVALGQETVILVRDLVIVAFFLTPSLLGIILVSLVEFLEMPEASILSVEASAVELIRAFRPRVVFAPTLPSKAASALSVALMVLLTVWLAAFE